MSNNWRATFGILILAALLVPACALLVEDCADWIAKAERADAEMVELQAEIDRVCNMVPLVPPRCEKAKAELVKWHGKLAEAIAWLRANCPAEAEAVEAGLLSAQ